MSRGPGKPTAAADPRLYGAPQTAIGVAKPKDVFCEWRDPDGKKVNMKLTRKTGFSIRMEMWESSTEFTIEEEKFYEIARHPDWTSARPRPLVFRRIPGTNEFMEAP